MENAPIDDGDLKLVFRRPVEPTSPTASFSTTTGGSIQNEKLLNENIEKDRIGTESSTLDILLTFTLPEELQPKAPLTLCCVLDVSGSMMDTLDSLKKAMNYIIDKLTDKDNLIIVTFNDTATVVLPSTPQNTNGKQTARNVIKGLIASGATDIVIALKTAVKSLKQRGKIPGSSSSTICDRNQTIFLLTDGEDGNNIEKDNDPYKHVMDECKALDCPVYTYGFGSNHDAKVMNHIATNTEGTFTFVKDTKSMNVSFLKAFSVVNGIITKDMVFCATVPTPPKGVEVLTMSKKYFGKTSSKEPSTLPLSTAVGGVQVSKIHCGFPFRIHNDHNYTSTDVIVNVGTVSVSEWRQILLRLHLPSVSINQLTTNEMGIREINHWVLDTQVQFTELSTNKKYVSPVRHIEIRRIYNDYPGTLELNNAKLSVAVQVARARAEAVQAVSEALVCTGNAKYKEAKKILDDALKYSIDGNSLKDNEILKALRADMNDLAVKLSKASDYEHGGQALALAFLSTHNTQRSTDTLLLSSKLYVTDHQEETMKDVVDSGTNVYGGNDVVQMVSMKESLMGDETIIDGRLSPSGNEPIVHPPKEAPPDYSSWQAEGYEDGGKFPEKPERKEKDPWDDNTPGKIQYPVPSQPEGNGNSTSIVNTVPPFSYLDFRNNAVASSTTTNDFSTTGSLSSLASSKPNIRGSKKSTLDWDTATTVTSTTTNTTSESGFEQVSTSSTGFYDPPALSNRGTSSMPYGNALDTENYNSFSDSTTKDNSLSIYPWQSSYTSTNSDRTNEYDTNTTTSSTSTESMDTFLNTINHAYGHTSSGYSQRDCGAFPLRSNDSAPKKLYRRPVYDE